MIRMVGAALVASCLTAAPAAAAGCPAVEMEQSFAGWGDPAWYWQAPGGSFDDGAPGWDLHGGAEVVEGSEPYGLAGESRHALRLGRGASAVSPPMCVDLAHPFFRYMVRPQGLGALLVEIESRRDEGPWVRLVSFAQPGLLRTAWAPALPHPLLTSLPLGTEGTAQIRLRFTALMTPWTVDSLMIDPYRRR